MLPGPDDRAGADRRDWAQHEADGEHVHHAIDDLASWLVDLADGLTPAR